MFPIAAHCPVCKTSTVPNIHGGPYPCPQCKPEQFRDATGRDPERFTRRYQLELRARTLRKMGRDEHGRPTS